MKVSIMQNYVNKPTAHNHVKPTRRPTANTEASFGTKNGVFQSFTYHAISQQLTVDGIHNHGFQPCKRRSFAWLKTVFCALKSRLPHRVSTSTATKNAEN